MSDQDKGKPVRFRPKARVIRTLGDRLVSGPVAALLELVKNAYDADAKRVVIGFSAKGHGVVERLSVMDDGHGLSLADFHEKWMEPATENKVQKRTSPGGRSMLGSKGIGRFAAARIGNVTLMETSRKISASRLESARVRIDWRKFEEGYLDEKTLVVYDSRTDGLSKGTSLQLTELREDWSGELLAKAIRELRRLSSPLGHASSSKFAVQIDVSALARDHPARLAIGILLADVKPERFDKGPVELAPFPLLASADYEVEGKFDARGTFKGTIQFNRSRQKTTTDLLIRVPIDPDRDEQSCGAVAVRLLVFDREVDSLKALIQRMGKAGEHWTPADIRQILDDTTGIAIYRNGFRIRPYGDNDQDWLTLDKRRVQDPSKHIGHNQVVGIVTVADERTSHLIEKSSREGLEENASYRRLVRLIQTMLDSGVEEHRYLYRRRLGIGTRKPKGFAEAHREALLQKLERTARSLPEKQRKAVQKEVARTSKKLQATLQDIEERQARLEAGATLGLIVAEVLHEGRQPVTFIVSAAKDASRAWPTLFDDSDKALKKRDSVGENLEQMEVQARRLERLFRLLVPISGRRRGRPTNFSVIDVVREAGALFRDRMETLGITMSVNVEGEAPRSHGYRDDLSAALTNLLDNSLFWLAHHRMTSPAIRITLSNEGGQCRVDVVDNGPGVTEEFRERLFEPGFSTKPDGTGLGLSISREALARSGATIEYVSVPNGSCFRLLMQGERK